MLLNTPILVEIGSKIENFVSLAIIDLPNRGFHMNFTNKAQSQKVLEAFQAANLAMEQIEVKVESNQDVAEFLSDLDSAYESTRANNSISFG